MKTERKNIRPVKKKKNKKPTKFELFLERNRILQAYKESFDF